MESQGLFKGTFPLLEKALDLRSYKHNVTVSNIANRDTPGFKAFDLVVEEEMEKIMGQGADLGLKKTHQRHLSEKTVGGVTAGHKAEGGSQISLRRDGNTVDLNKEMAKLAENNLLYDALAQIISRKFKGLKDVIQGGK